MPPSNHTEDLRLAHILADNADSISLSRFRADDLAVAHKEDASPVTDADHAVEEAIRNTLKKARPRDAVHGEEFENTGFGPRRWIIDPIDGTKNYVRGVPVWATLIALEVDGEVAVGVVSAPALNRRWWASLGGGAYAGKSLMQGQQIHVSEVATLGEASLSYAGLGSWMESGHGQEFVDLMRSCWRTRAYGEFWQYMLVAEGGVDIATEPRLNEHDIAAPSIIVREAGGEFTDIHGAETLTGHGALATNGFLHEAVVAALRPADGGDPSDAGH